jgi:hypothetical protein
MATSFNIKDFRASLSHHGVLMNNKFLMVIQRPPGMPGEDMQRLTLRCDSASMPTVAINAIEGILRYGHGVPEKVPHYAGFQDLTASFITSKDAYEVGFFNRWLNLIFNFDTSNGIWTESRGGQGAFEVGYKSEYATTITIFIYNDQTDKVVEIALVDAWPTGSNVHNLDWSDHTNQKLQMNIYYRNYIMKTVQKTKLEELLTGIGRSLLEELG